MPRNKNDRTTAYGVGPVLRIAARAAAFCKTIRGRILVAFLIMSLITAALGAYATLGIKDDGVLVRKTYDQSLMAINYARAAATDFAAMRAVFARRWIAQDPKTRDSLDKKVKELAKTLKEDLGIAVQRAQSDRARKAAANVERAATAWKSTSERLLDKTKLDATLGIARRLRRQGRRTDRSSGQLHRRRRIPLPGICGIDHRPRHAPKHRRHPSGAAVVRRGRLGAGAAHHQAGRGRLGDRRLRREGQARRRHPQRRRGRARRSARLDEADARQHQGDDGTRSRPAPFGSEPARRRAGRLARRRRGHRRAGPHRTCQCPGHQPA